MATEKKKSARVITPVGRAAFVNLFEPDEYEGKEAYRIALVFDRNDQNVPAGSMSIDEIALLCLKAAAKHPRWGEKARRVLAEFKPLNEDNAVDACFALTAVGIKMPIKDAEEKAEWGEPFGNADHVYISASTKNAPDVVSNAKGPTGRPKKIVNHGDVYSGMWARLSAGVWAFDKGGGRGVTLLLNNVQKIADDDKLAGGPSAEEEFKPVNAGGVGKSRKSSRSDDDDGDDEGIFG